MKGNLKNKHTVTGAFGYSGQYIALRLLANGHEVNTLTDSQQRQSPLNGKIESSGFHFDEPEKLVNYLKNTKVLYNNYWVRFNHKTFTHEEAVQNSFTLIDAAKKAGVEKVVHISITNPSLDSDLEYFHGKARIEEKLKNSGLSYCILRPAVIFGGSDILINNIAWVARHFPIFPLFGNGNYKLQPIHVDDLAKIAVEKGTGKTNETFNVIGEETYTYKKLIETICHALGKKRLIFPAPAYAGYLAGKIIGAFTKDVMITKEEIKGLTAGLLYVNPKEPCIKGETSLQEYVDKNWQTIGNAYASEIKRRIQRKPGYGQL
ncbi:MAG: NmrA family NAD(P)-binding protein [Leptospirales bacterium]